ncbi:hypothetical protein COO20_08850 [Thalassospira marina]|uniref:Uncharacterized protein n=1 Tax=Thalassospira marina TaxID=2048283 RepID=A0A2N3KUS2_9PROT|nr:hypothetical protein COO20_08850 [Thalassospira marina]
MTMKASARKSYGEYKPVIIHDPDGVRRRTEIVGKRDKYRPIVAETVFYSGPSEEIDWSRGVTFVNRDDAIKYAERLIKQRLARRKAFRDKAAQK